jgi:serine/threonine protein kinase
MKVLPASLREDPVALLRLQREARAIASLSHPNIVAIHDVGPDGKRFLMVRDVHHNVAANRIVVVLNWTTELRRLMAERN